MRKKKDIERLKKSFGKLKDTSFQFELIEKYFRNKDHSKDFQTVSDKTCNDLDFQELFMFLDRTNSKVGQQYLYNKLRTIPENSDNHLNEEIISRLIVDIGFRTEIQIQLERLKKVDAYYITSLFQEEHLRPPKWFPLVRVLSFTSIILVILLPFFPYLFFVLMGIILINLGVHYWNKKNLYQYLGSIPELLRLNNIALKLHKEKLLKKIDPNLPESIKIINQVKNRMSFIQLESKLQDEAGAIVWGILELFKIIFVVEPLLLFAVLKLLNGRRDEIENVFSFVGQIDSLISIASLRNGLTTYCIPAIDKGNKSLVAKELYHPLILDCVPNSIEVNDKSILLTGSNMSGKTSFIRSVGLNFITALTINTCFAQSMAIPRIRIYSAIRISDDLMNDKSYYFEEVLTIKDMIQKSNDGIANLFLLDEIFKGTNTVERIAAGKAVLSSISNKDNIVFVSTHDIELADLLAGEYELYHFSEIVDGKNIDFDYKLKPGKLKNRNAIRILQINDYPDHVINEAVQISKKLDIMSIRDKIQ